MEQLPEPARSSQKRYGSSRSLTSLFRSEEFPGSPGLLEFRVVALKLTQLLFAIAIFFFLASIVVNTLKYELSYIRPNGEDRLLVRLFDLDSENNIPTIYGSWLLLACSVLLGLIALMKHRQGDRFRLHWKGLAIIFLGMSIDELASIHETITNPLHHYLKVDGIWHFAWVVPALCFVALLGVAYFKFLLALPRKIGLLFLVSGGIYISGALVSEMIGGIVASAIGEKNLIYSLVTDVEELLEMTGLILFIYALLRYVPMSIHTLQINFGYSQLDRFEKPTQGSD